MTSYQMMIDTLNSHLFKMWQNGYNRETWNEENAKEISHTILRQVEIFKKNQVQVTR
jgi:hypothetical protein